MSQVAISGNASGTGTLTIAAPNTNSNYTLTLPTVTGTVLTNKTAGTVLQVQNVQSGSLASTTTTIPLDNTIPQNTEGAELFTVSITPTSSTSKLLITANVELSSSAGGWLIIAIFQDSTANAIAATTSYMATATGGLTIPLTYYMTSGTTSSTTFKLRYGQSAAGTTSVNASGGSQLFGGVCISSMTVTEIAV